MDSPQTALGASNLVGRDAELSLLDRRLTEAADGRGGMVLLAGEPGIGKSCLADEAARLARNRGFRVVWGRCRETEGAPPFWPWTQILRGVLAGSGIAAPADLQPLLDSRPQAGRDADRFQLFDAVTTLLVDRAHHQPLLVVLDDLHRADHSSLLLLEFLAPAVGDAPLLLVGTFRDTEVSAPHPLFTILGEGASGGGVDLLELGGLTPADTARLVAGQAPAGTPLRAEELQQRCDGNPFFMTELLRLRPGVGEAVPTTVSAAISARVERLPESTRRVLALAAVLGREFAPPLLAVLDGSPSEEIDAVGAENASWPLSSGFVNASLVAMTHREHCMIARCGLPTRLPDAHPRARLAGTARPIRRRERRRDHGAARRGRRAAPKQPPPEDISVVRRER